MSVTLDHIVLNVADIDASLKFYTAILQFEAERLDAFRSGTVPLPSVRVDEGTVIDLFPPTMWKAEGALGNRKTNLNHYCIAMSEEDWIALRARLFAAGAELHRDRSRNWGAHGEGISMYFFDPDGNEIEARYYEQ